MRAIFKDNDGRWTYVRGYREFDLGFYHPGRYIWAATQTTRQQVCSGGEFRGNTLSWPGAKVLSYRNAKDALGRPMSVPEYADLPDTILIKWLSKTLGARAYKSRDSFEHHYWKHVEREESQQYEALEG